MSNLRIFFSSAIFSFRAQFSWLNPPMWLTLKFVLGLSQMAFFVFVGKYINSQNPNPVADLVQYIAIGNAVQTVAWNTVFSVINITGHDKWDGTLPLLIATPANRLPIFIGRAMMHVLDGMLSVAINFAFAITLFGVNFSNADLLALAVAVVLTAFTMAGFGLLIGGFSFYFREPMVLANIFTFILLIFCGVNFEVSQLPEPLRPISQAFPLTYGIWAARDAIKGQSLIAISPLLGEQLIVGLVSIAIGYLFFTSFERAARKTGRIEAV